MKVLIIDSSTEYLTCRFYDESIDKLYFEKTMISHNNHSENLLPSIEEGLNKTGFKLQDFDKIIVGSGPGSYTGLRIGLVVAKMISYSLNIPLFHISSLFLCGSGYFTDDGIYAVTSVAKKNYSYMQIVKVENNNIFVQSEDEFLETSLAEEKIVANNAKKICEGNYQINDKIVCNFATKVDNIHDFVPNYLRKANS